jgi:hypothetical protein
MAVFSSFIFCYFWSDFSFPTSHGANPWLKLRDVGYTLSYGEFHSQHNDKDCCIDRFWNSSSYQRFIRGDYGADFGLDY